MDYPTREQIYDAVGMMKHQLRPVPDEHTDPERTAAAVLIGIIEQEDGEPGIVFTKRSMSVATHKGQISFPGGVIEESDVDAAYAAKREAFEEIGLACEYVRTLGYMSNVHTVSDFEVVPVVALIDKQATFSRSPEEVESIFTVSLRHLINPEIQSTKQRTYNGRTYTDHRFSTENGVIWGATGRMLEKILSLLFPTS